MQTIQYSPDHSVETFSRCDLLVPTLLRLFLCALLGFELPLDLTLFFLSMIFKVSKGV
ncbi:protein of unknown function [Candidatus Promineifilum breve]|uniref:Uncharacterized protein n=1 Tax=Candidatus Promineifilum breve TaxID=1806508 RepID=A0A160T5C3_9CHLR|nr:protein of unknown function [Candidatus Promineifilum breve]